jgi:micrococcal nuclease
MMKTYYSTLFIPIVLQTYFFFALVIGVTDGDTIIVLNDKKEQIKVRLEGIDCPEKKQAFGEKAKQSTVNLCFQKKVKVVKTGTDKYGRMLALVYVNDTCISKELLRLGMAWHFKKYNSDPELAELEKIAKNNKVGLWAEKDPIAPWDYRHKK